MIKITSATLTKDLTLNVGYVEEIIDSETEIKSIKTHPQVKCTLIVHNDLAKMFEQLAGHLAKVCELPEMANKNPEEELYPEGIKVNKVVISGEDELSVTMYGSRQIQSGTMPIENPSIKLYDGNYEHLEELSERINSLQEEVILYLNGKTNSKRQLNIFEDASEFSNEIMDPEFEDEEPVSTKKKRQFKKVAIPGLEGMSISVSSGPVN
jgi:hypothetical protein